MKAPEHKTRMKRSNQSYLRCCWWPCSLQTRSTDPDCSTTAGGGWRSPARGRPTGPCWELVTGGPSAAEPGPFRVFMPYLAARHRPGVAGSPPPRCYSRCSWSSRRRRCWCCPAAGSGPLRTARRSAPAPATASGNGAVRGGGDDTGQPLRGSGLTFMGPLHSPTACSASGRTSPPPEAFIDVPRDFLIRWGWPRPPTSGCSEAKARLS